MTPHFMRGIAAFETVHPAHFRKQTDHLSECQDDADQTDSQEIPAQVSEGKPQQITDAD